MSLVDGKIALVTGAGNGIGAACAKRLADEGAKVVVTDIAEEDAKSVAGEIGAAAVAFRLDISQEADWRGAIDLALEHFGGLDILVNNAAIYNMRTLEDTDPQMMERFFRVNQLGPFLGMRAAIAPMKKRGGGSIINIVSVAGLNGHPGVFAYGTAKWAVRGMTRNAAKELSAYNIRVNAILPGLIDTKMVAGMDRSTIESLLAVIPLGRIGKPEDVASAALFLASDMSDYMTGSEVVVDAGRAA